ncbi:MAG TPA: hypothetical protein VJ085_10505, partial [Candidatus Acidoferrales bacterium]|nr:hypothetical protein [Candidatus Acidoferrales bacterium]
IAGFQHEFRDIFCGTPTASGCPLNATTSNTGFQNFFASTFFDLDSFQERFEARYEVNDWLTVRGGLFYLDRDWKFLEFESASEGGGVPDTDTHTEEIGAINRSWLAGLVLKPNKRIQIFFDMENGDYTRVFNRQMPADLDRYRLRGRFEPWDGIRFNGSWFIFDNQNFKAPIPNPLFLNTCVTSGTNPAVFPAADPIYPVTCGDGVNVSSVPAEELPGRHSSRNRGGTVDFQLARFERGYLNAGYSRNDITAITDVTFPVSGTPNPPYGAGVFLYLLNENYFYVDAGGRVAGNLYVDAGYRIVDSSGSFPPSDPAGACVPLESQNCDNANLDPFEIFAGGLMYHQPHVSVRYAFSDNVSWKFGWRYYHYNQEVGTFSDYDSHIVTTSVVLSF